MTKVECVGHRVNSPTDAPERCPGTLVIRARTAPVNADGSYPDLPSDYDDAVEYACDTCGMVYNASALMIVAVGLQAELDRVRSLSEAATAKVEELLDAVAVVRRVCVARGLLEDPDKLAVAAVLHDRAAAREEARTRALGRVGVVEVKASGYTAREYHCYAKGYDDGASAAGGSPYTPAEQELYLKGFDDGKRMGPRR